MGALEAPQDKYGQEHRTGTSRAEQTDKDHGGAGSSGSHGGAGSTGAHGGAGSSGGHGGAGSSGSHGGAGSSEDHGGAGSSGGHGGAGSSGGHGRWSSGALASVLSARPLQPELLLPPPKKNFPGEVRGYQEPSGARHRQTVPDSPPGLNIQEQDRTGQPSGAKQTGTGQDRTAHRNQKPFWAGLEAEASSGHDQESEALTGSLSDRLHINDRGGRRQNGLHGH